MEAFERARAEGARAIELDARTCAGGDVVVFHDETLERMTRNAVNRRVSDVPLAELRALDLGRGARIPTLGEVLDWARHRDVAVNVELKHDTRDRGTLSRGALRSVRSRRADVLLSSFDPGLLAMAAVLAPEVPRALLVHADQPRWASALQEVARPPWVSALHLEKPQATARSLARYARRGLRCGVWTVNDEYDALELVGLGVRTVITDAPGVVLAALNRRK
jgi:glycerophosphoryl diester phosphodiesterase